MFHIWKLTKLTYVTDVGVSEKKKFGGTSYKASFYVESDGQIENTEILHLELKIQKNDSSCVETPNMLNKRS